MTFTDIQDGTPVCGPDLPPTIRRRALRHRTRRYTSYGSLAGGAPVADCLGRRHRRRIVWLIRAAIAAWLLLSFARSNVLQYAATGLLFAISASLIALRAEAAATRVTDSVMLRVHRGQFIDIADLGEASRVQLLRTQRAIATVTGSSLHSDGMLDRDEIDEILAAHHWEIARLLIDLERLRAEHSSRRRGTRFPGTAGGIIEDIARHQTEAFAQAADAIELRVQAIEAYAASTREANAAYLAWQQALNLSELDSECVGLVARATAGDYTTAQVSRLSDSATAARTGFQDKLTEAQQTAQALTGALTS